MTTPRLLRNEDVQQYRAIRLAALHDSPWAFGSSPGDDRTEFDGFFDDLLDDPDHHIIVIDHPDRAGELACILGLRREPARKARHLASIWGVYTIPEMRGSGFARCALQYAIEIASQWDTVCRVGLSASVRSVGAIALYESLGFVRWGTEPGVTRVGGEDIDEVHLSLKLDGDHG